MAWCDRRICLLAAFLAACQAPVTWSHQVAPVLETYCTRCHNDLGAAPFSLQTYADAKVRTAQIKRELERGTMPPWLPADGCRPLDSTDTNRPTAADVQLIRDWVSDQAPEGKSGTSAKVVTPPNFDGEMQTLSVTFNPAGHAIHAISFAQCYKIPLNSTTSRQLIGFEAETTKPKSLIAVGLYRLSAEQATTIADDFECELQPGVPAVLSPMPFAKSGFLGVWQQGNGPVRFPTGTGVTLAADDVLILRLRLHPTAIEGFESHHVRLKFASAPVQEARVLSIANSDFMVPPFSDTIEDSATFVAPSAGRIYGIAPHLRVRGRALRLDADGTCALSLSSWSDQWQSMYWFSGEPLPVSAGTKLNLNCAWNNALSDAVVRPGDGPADELCAASLYWVDNIL